MKIFMSIMLLYETGVLSIQYNEINNIISDSEVELAIKQLKHDKATGCDHLINELYIYVINYSPNYLHCSMLYSRLHIILDYGRRAL